MSLIENEFPTDSKIQDRNVVIYETRCVFRCATGRSFTMAAEKIFFTRAWLYASYTTNPSPHLRKVMRAISLGIPQTLCSMSALKATNIGNIQLVC